MPLTPWLPTVRRIKDGEAVDQQTVNVHVDQLTQRDQHLYEKFDELLGKSVLISFGQRVHPTETIVPGELSLLYYKKDQYGEGTSRAMTGFSSSGSSSMFTPDNANYVFGVIKAYYPDSNTVDLYTEGLCDFSVDIDDPIFGLIQKDSNGGVEPFEVGPYYLSRREPGKITRDPAGIPVYAGYAISKRKFLIHANVDEFSQFFINYRYHILDRVAGIPDNDGSTWSISSADSTKLGWLPVNAVPYAHPPDAVFYFNIPALHNSSVDTTLTQEEREEAIELSKFLPPIPANFIQLYINGILMRYRDEFDIDGVYSINQYGLWWHTAALNDVPWSVNYPTSAPIAWSATKASLATDRKSTFVSFSKFNPALRTQLVSSLAPFDIPEDNSTNFIKFYSKDNISKEAATGDLLVSVDPQFTELGYSSLFTAPPTQTQTYTAGRAVAELTYSKQAGVFVKTVTPVVAKIVGAGGITATETPAESGVWTVGYRTEGQTGFVDSIEPINSRLEFRGLTSYIKLPIPTLTPYGLIGKIVLPKGYSGGNPLQLVFYTFGDVDYDAGVGARGVTFSFEYSSTAVANVSRSSALPAGKTLVSTLSNPAPPAIVNFDIMNQATEYPEYQLQKIVNPGFQIPAEYVHEESVVNFKIMRVSAGDQNPGYPGNIGLVSVHWTI
jgi:hypothetical protein